MVQITMPPSNRPNRPNSGGKGKASTAAGHTPSGQSTLFAGVNPDFHVLPFVTVFDHRERAGGWRFGGMVGGSDEKYRPLLVPTKEIHMVTADYSLEDPATGERVSCYIERKSHDDCIGSIGGGHHNLRLEHERMKSIIDGEPGGYCCVIVESSLSAILDDLDSPMTERKLTSAGVLGVVASWPQKFGVNWFFAGDRRTAERLALTVLRKAWERRKES